MLFYMIDQSAGVSILYIIFGTKEKINKIQIIFNIPVII